jgi:hypothetical protein
VFDTVEIFDPDLAWTRSPVGLTTSFVIGALTVASRLLRP